MDLSPDTLAKLLATGYGSAALLLVALVWTTFKLHAARDKYEKLLEKKSDKDEEIADELKRLAEAQTKLADRNQLVSEILAAKVERR